MLRVIQAFSQSASTAFEYSSDADLGADLGTAFELNVQAVALSPVFYTSIKQPTVE